MIEIYTDGSCCGNGTNKSNGGYAIIIMNENILLDCKYENNIENTTNNRMEIKALIAALDIATNVYSKEKVIIKSDSAYCVNMFNTWIYSWARNGWHRTGNKEIENLDLVKELYKYTENGWPNYIVEKIHGHAGFAGNELADAAATGNLTKFTKILKENNIKYNDRKYDLFFI